MRYSELKRLAGTEALSLELIEWHGGDVPERLKGIRRVLWPRSYGFDLMCMNDTISELRIESAKLVDCDGNYLTVFKPAERPLTEEEQNILQEWKQREEEYFKYNPMGDSYWKKKSFFANSQYPYMDGFTKNSGKRYLSHNNTVLDNSLKGDKVLVYRMIVNRNVFPNETELVSIGSFKKDKRYTIVKVDGNLRAVFHLWEDGSYTSIHECEEFAPGLYGIGRELEVS